MEDPIKLWQHIHGASAHFPIAMIFVSFGFDFGAILFKRLTWRTVGFWTLIVATVVAMPAIVSGLTGYLGWFHVEKWDAEHLITHRNYSLAAGGALLILTGWRIARWKALSEKLVSGEVIAYLIALAAAVGITGYTGYLGAYVARGY